MKLEHKIEIEYRDEPDAEMHGVRQSGWWVIYGDRYADWLCYEEMLGLVAALTMPDNPNRRCVSWLRTRDQRNAENQRRQERRKSIDNFDAAPQQAEPGNAS